MAKIKGVDYENGEMTAVYVENADEVHRFVAVRHGRWYDVKEKRPFGDRYLLCSNCKSRNGSMITFNYCPNCGSKMDGESDE